MLGRIREAAASISHFQRDVLTTFLARVITLACSVATMAIVARALGPEGKGQVTVALMVPAILSLVFGLGIGAANTYYVGSQATQASRLVGNSVTLALLGTGAALLPAALIASVADLRALIPNVPVAALLLACLNLPALLLGANLQGALQGLQRIQQANLISLVHSLASLALTLILVGLLQMKVMGAILAALLGSLASCSAALYLLSRLSVRVRPAWEWPLARAQLGFGLRAYVGNVLQFFNYRIDTFVVNYFLGSASVGLYSTSVTLAELLWYLPNAVGFVIFPKAAASSKEEMDRFTPRVFRLTLLLTGAGALALLALAPLLIRIVFSEAFLPAYRPMAILLPGVVLLGGGKVLTNELAGRGRPILNSANSLLALVATVVLDLVLIPRLGIEGAAIASTISYVLTFVAAVAFYLAVSRQDPRRLLFPARKAAHLPGAEAGRT